MSVACSVATGAVPSQGLTRIIEAFAMAEVAMIGNALFLESIGRLGVRPRDSIGIDAFLAQPLVLIH